MWAFVAETMGLGRPAALASLAVFALIAYAILRGVDDEDRIHSCWPRPDVEYGHRVCRAFETYLLLHPDNKLSFEWAWNLLQNVSRNDELYLAACGDCHTRYVQDAYALDQRVCPSCTISRKALHG